SGIVQDASTQKGIPFVTLYIPALDKGGHSDIDGNFNIEKIPNGQYQMVVSSVGYKTFSQQITMPGEGVLTIELSHADIEMDEVIVSTPFHKLQSEHLMKVAQANVKNLKAQRAITLAYPRSQISGVETLSTVVRIGKPVIRGLSRNRV